MPGHTSPELAAWAHQIRRYMMILV
jgi:hypothetical protein